MIVDWWWLVIVAIGGFWLREALLLIDNKTDKEFDKAFNNLKSVASDYEDMVEEARAAAEDDLERNLILPTSSKQEEYQKHLTNLLAINSIRGVMNDG